MKNKKTQNKQQAKSGAVSWTANAWEEYLSWQKDDREMVEAINVLIDACRRDPFKGIGKPEPLKHNLTGLWSRRITHEHRLVYLPEGEAIYIVSCRFHY